MEARLECLFTALESHFPTYFAPNLVQTLQFEKDEHTFRYRAYPLTSSFLAMQMGRVLYLGAFSSYRWGDFAVRITGLK
ncbi:hypothetical protein JCM31598_27510 [Desulfonatronum parangueonense]